MPLPAEPRSPSLTAGPSAEEAADADEDYLYFLRHVHVDGDAYTLVIPSKEGSSALPEIIRYEQPLADHNAGAPVAGSESRGEWAPPPPSEENSGATSEAAPCGVKRKAPDASPDGEVRSDAVPVEENTPTPVAEEEEDGLPAPETEDGVDSGLPIPEVFDPLAKEKEKQDVNDPVHYETNKVIEEENTSNALAKGKTGLDPLDKKEEASSSKEHLPMPLNVSELQGVIWPPHINKRPNSVFKEKLIECLIKPFTQEEYDRYFSLATKKTSILKERRTRNNVAYYETQEMGNSYFDWYPDLAEQFNLQRNNYSIGLALLRGLFFWLQNITQEEQFMPWSNEFKTYRVVHILD